MTTGVRGVGVDIVDLGAFAASLAEPGTRLTRAFSPTERRPRTLSATVTGAPVPPISVCTQPGWKLATTMPSGESSAASSRVAMFNAALLMA